MLLELSHTQIIDATLWILIVFSIVTWGIIGYKAWQNSSIRLSNDIFLKEFLDSSQLAEARGVTEWRDGALSRIAKAGFSFLEVLSSQSDKSLRDRGEPGELLERNLEREIVREVGLMESGLTLLASIGMTSPFVGLFGTVWGIKCTLEDIGKSGAAGLDIVTGAFSEALVVTAIGIAVAVPAVARLLLFSSANQGQPQSAGGVRCRFPSTVARQSL